MNLKQIRLSRGITVPELVNLSGLSRRTIQEVEKRDTCSVKTALKLADALGVTLDELCRDTYNTDSITK